MRHTSLALAAMLSLCSFSALAQGTIVPGRQPTTLDAQLPNNNDTPPAASYAPAAGEEGDYNPPPEELVRTSEAGIKYATGGVGAEEMAQLKAVEGSFNLRVLSTLDDGAYIGYYALRVTDTAGKSIFEAPGDGPYFYVSLPPGTYNVEVQRRDRPSKSQKVTVGGGAKSLQFRWPNEE